MIATLPDWMTEGLCAQVDPDEFFPTKGDPCSTAKKVCAACPVREACLTFALDNDERHGVWGGKSVRERRLLTAQNTSAGGAA